MDEERDALRRDRYRGGCEVGRCKGNWPLTLPIGGSVPPERAGLVYRIAMVNRGDSAQPRPGRKPKLPRERESELKARLDAGPRAEMASAPCGAGCGSLLEKRVRRQVQPGRRVDLLER